MRNVRPLLGAGTYSSSLKLYCLASMRANFENDAVVNEYDCMFV